MTHRWILSGSPDAAPLAGAFDPLVARVLAARGHSCPEEAGAWCAPKLTELHDPTLLPGLETAADRLLTALERRETIAIYGDYDVDGISASAILFHVLRAIDPDAGVITYVPHRLDEGYGLNAEAIQSLAQLGAGVIVSVDCGITAREPAARARAAGVDLIITDHHNLPAREDELPDALALVHPRLPDSEYPFGELCGAGVAFKLAWRLATRSCGSERVGGEMREVLLDLLALAALGTIADIVPLEGENRVLTRFGLKRLPFTRIEGLNRLIEASGLSGERIESDHVGFMLGPRLNAIGRLGHAKDAVDLLTSATGDHARSIAEGLSKVNDERKQTERRIIEAAEAMAVERGMTGDDRRAIVLASEDWHAGVVGICCSRLIGRFHRPTILLARTGDRCHGSGRSIDGFNLHAALNSTSHLLETFGGHDMAAGLALHANNLDRFVEEFTGQANERLGADDLVPSVRVDCDASVQELQPESVRRLDELGPFGRANPKPLVRIVGARVTRAPAPFGARGAHLGVYVGDSTREIRLVGWRWGDSGASIPTGAPLEAVVEPKINSWNGRVSVEPVLVDLRVGETAALRG